jgi:hypothetical protein
MGLDQKGDVVFRVSRGENSQWDVSERGFEKPLASFDSEKEACGYANDLASTKEGSRVVVDGRDMSGRLGLPGRGKSGPYG